MHPPIPIRRNLIKQSQRQINIIFLTAHTSINNSRPSCLSRAGIINADFGAAFGVAVWICGVGHHGDGEGDDGVVGAGCVAAGTDAGGVVRHVADVGGGEGDGDCEGESGAEFHCGDVGVWFWG